MHFLLDQKIAPYWNSLLKAQRQSLIGDPSFLPLYITGGIGDLILTYDAIQFLKKRFNLLVSTKHLEAFKYFYGEEIPVTGEKLNLTWYLDWDTIPHFRFSDHFSGFQNPEHRDLFLKQRVLLDETPQMNRLWSQQERYYLLALYGKERGWTRRDSPLRFLGYEEPLAFETRLRKPPKKYFTLHDGYDSSQGSAVYGRATKTWMWESWNELVRRMKKEFPEYEIYQLGSSTSRPIDGVQNLINRTSIPQAFDILSHSALHIDGDSGLVHAATRMSVPCVVMWGPTPDHFYGYDENMNLKSGQTCGQACYGLLKNWNHKCPIGFNTPRCMDEITVDQVMDAIIHGPMN